MTDQITITRALLEQALESLLQMTKKFNFERLHESRLSDSKVRVAAHDAMNAIRAELAKPVEPAVVAPFERPVGRLRACDAAVAVLRETGEPGVMYGDEWLCHQIAKRLGWKPNGPWTTRRVLAALARTPGHLIVSKIRMPSDCCARGQSVLHNC